MSDPRTLPQTMAAMVLTGHGDFDRLVYRQDYPAPSPSATEVLIKVGAAGINNTDINTRIGWYSQSQTDDGQVSDGAWTGASLGFPLIQGADVCGTIWAVGEGVDQARIGQRVLVQPCLVSLREGLSDIWLGSERNGGFAEFVCVPSADAHTIHSPLSDAQLASFPCAYGTAENLLTRSAVKGGERVLITGATGGVGSAAVQLAKRRGAEVLALVSPQKRVEAERLGADRLISRDQPLLEALSENSIDVVIDVVGGPDWPHLLEALKPRGRYAVSGAIAGPMVSLDLRKLYLKDLTLLGCTAQEVGPFQALIGYIERGEIQPLLAKTYPLAEMIQAQKDFLDKRHIGKLVVVPPQ
jgi:NADPH:quinone reductase-like Zn-dependent oxidoreductase